MAQVMVHRVVEKAHDGGPAWGRAERQRCRKSKAPSHADAHTQGPGEKGRATREWSEQRLCDSPTGDSGCDNDSCSSRASYRHRCCSCGEGETVGTVQGQARPVGGASAQCQRTTLRGLRAAGSGGRAPRGGRTHLGCGRPRAGPPRSCGPEQGSGGGRRPRHWAGAGPPRTLRRERGAVSTRAASGLGPPQP